MALFVRTSWFYSRGESCRALTRFALPAVLLAFAVPARADTLLHLSDLYYEVTPPTLNQLTHTLKFTWDHPGPDVSVDNLARRAVAGGAMTYLPPSTNGQRIAYDTGWQSGVQYEYYLVGTAFVIRRDAQGNIVYDSQGNIIRDPVPWESNRVPITPCDIAATATGTADSRVDKRYGNIHYQDYPFNADPKPNNKPGVFLYRGGLYAGHNGDSSQIGRSYLKFPLIAPPVTGELLYPFGGLWAFSTRNARTGSVSVAAQRASSSTWAAPTLIWTNAPAPVGTATPATAISWNAQNPTFAWYKLDALKLVEDQLAPGGGGNLLTALLVGGSETSGAGWAYFAANGYQHRVVKPDNTVEVTSGYGPRFLYAWGGPGLNEGGGDPGGGGDDPGDGGFYSAKPTGAKGNKPKVSPAPGTGARP